MSEPIRTPNLSLVYSPSEIMAHEDMGDGRRRLGRTPTGVLATMLGLYSIAAWAPTRAALQGMLGYPANSGGFVLADVEANNGVYIKVGGAGTGSWQRVRDLFIGGLGVSEAALAAAVEVLQTRISAVEQGATDLVAKEITDRVLGDNSLTARLAQEIDDRVAVEADLAQRIRAVTLPAGRPGDAPASYALADTGGGLAGREADLPRLPAEMIAFGSDGAVVRMTDVGAVGPVQAIALEPGRVWRVRWAVRRRADAVDPSGDTVRIAVLWLDQSKALLATTPRLDVVNILDLRVLDGRRIVETTISASPGASVVHIAPDGAVYCRPYVQSFATTGLLDIEVIAAEDVTSATLLPPASADLAARVAAVESQNAGARLTLLEAQAQAPNSVTYATRTDAAAATIPGSVTTVQTRGRTAAGDGRHGLYARIAGSLPAGADGFASADGATWKLVILDQALSNAMTLGSAPGAALVYTGSAPQLYAARATSGTVGPGNGDLNALMIPFDAMSITGGAANSFVNYFSVIGQIQGGTRGGRQGMNVLVQQNAPSASGNENRNYVGGTFGAYNVAGDGGGSATMAGGLGAYFGLNPWAVLGAGATNVLNLSGIELNVACRAGSSVAYKSGIQICKYGDDRVPGSVWNAAISVSDQNNAAAPWTDILLVSNANGVLPIHPDGYLLRLIGGDVVGVADFSISAKGFIKSEAYSNGGSIRPVMAQMDGTLTAVPNAPPASASAPGTPGQTAFDANFFYQCVAVNTWRRAPLQTW